MKARIIELINNFYIDNVEEATKSNSAILGNFCVFGYFDAMQVHEIRADSEYKLHIWDKLSNRIVEQQDNHTHQRNLICITEDDEGDELFWESKSDFPFFFITMVRLKQNKCFSEDLMQLVKKMRENTKTVITYLSYDHSEIIVVKKTNSYKEGVRYVFSLRAKFPIFKMHTIYSVKEDTLCSYENIIKIIEDDIINCRFHCVVKSFEKANDFYHLLTKKIKERNNKNIVFQRNDTIGNQDWLIEINDVPLCSILEHYKSGNLLTHSNPSFAAAFFNVETEILLKNEEYI